VLCNYQRGVVARSNKPPRVAIGRQTELELSRRLILNGSVIVSLILSVRSAGTRRSGVRRRAHDFGSIWRAWQIASSADQRY